MDRDQLRTIQAPLKDRYKSEPSAAFITLSASGELGEGVSCSVQTARAISEAGLHPLTGGDGSLLCSGDMLLEALVACAGVTLRAVSTSLGISVPAGRGRRDRAQNGSKNMLRAARPATLPWSRPLQQTPVT